MLAAKSYQAATIRALLFAQRATPTPYGVNSSSLVQSFASLYDKVASNGLSKQVTPVTHEPSTYTGALSSPDIFPQICLPDDQIPCCGSVLLCLYSMP